MRAVGDLVGSKTAPTAMRNNHIPVNRLIAESSSSNRNTETLARRASEAQTLYNWGGAHDKFVNDADLLAAQNLIIVQVSATPYCNLTLNSRVPKKYIVDPKKFTASNEFESKDAVSNESENKDVDEELHIVKWYPPHQSITSIRAEKSRYLRLEYFLRSILSQG